MNYSDDIAAKIAEEIIKLGFDPDDEFIIVNITHHYDSSVFLPEEVDYSFVEINHVDE